jgi:glucans biosynthesis protein
VAQVRKTLISDRAALHYGKPSGARLYLVDFAGGDLAYYSSAIEDLELALQATSGTASAERLTWNPHARSVRARIFAEVALGQSTDISATLLHRGKPLSETWLAHWIRHPAREQELASGMGVR